MVWLLAEYSEASAYSEYRALRQFFRSLAAEEELPDPMAGLRGPGSHRSRCPSSPDPCAGLAAVFMLRLSRSGLAPYSGIGLDVVDVRLQSGSSKTTFTFW